VIRPSTDTSSVLAQYNAPPKTNPEKNSFLASALPIEDKVTISTNIFKVKTSVEDYLPQSRGSKKKNFKSIKEFAAYLLMLLMKIRDLKPKPGEIHAKMEDQGELAKALEDLKSIRLS
jgi:hypothetical protein